ncbi:arginine transporter [Erwinia sp. OLTSP20]|uniref:arginine exporter ArgO n=1 Tax=unclassified Erwinia TaxID=2622719 RepID=UPI000C18E1D1|nr:MULTISPECIES: arginine exporter ArgO [unclassified Erwinia]PIJ48982.1 arginine transporter [Erwinia sp. OAMSP11]PIJ74635.1 arginine transporter [Erwinia sp. OLSSP12]PIJ79666.1 arginine transporter [Erwinia sp. OLCASP19]PIJ80451.1 arginine transporter [Erwinia sp. OLMTSP26]PIJ82566.1 arginine transporter [Erwinia sp. OLMDSP33]
MLSVYFQGIALGAALILPLGPQNAFVMNQGINRQYHFMTAGLCTLSDIVLICAGVFGGSALLNRSPLLLALISWGGVAFLLWYGWGALRTGFHPQHVAMPQQADRSGRWRIVLTVLAVTWLNPHVYLDTFVVLGSLGGQLPASERIWFACGTISASLLWFFGVALLASWLAPRLVSRRAQQRINLLVGAIMWFVALRLAQQSIAML